MASLNFFSVIRSGSRGKCWRGLRLGARIVTSLLGAKGWTQTELSEYQLKAVFLFNFSKFVEWPAEAFADDESPLGVGVFGNDPFGGMLDDIVQGEKVGRRALIVHRYRRVEEIGVCHILLSANRSPSGWKLSFHR